MEEETQAIKKQWYSSQIGSPRVGEGGRGKGVMGKGNGGGTEREEAGRVE